MYHFHQRKGILVFVAFSFLVRCHSLDQKGRHIAYPNVFRNESTYQQYQYGINNITEGVADPYRWMEDTVTPRNVALTKEFVDEQNKITLPYVEQYKYRENLKERLSEIWNYPKYNEILYHGNKYFQFANTGLQNQDVLYIQDSLEEPTNRRVFLDPNLLSNGGTVSLSKTRGFSKSGSIFAYAVSQSGSDWLTIKFRNVSSGLDLEDELTKVKFTEIEWKGDEGIFYGHYPLFQGELVGSDPEMNKNQKISYHKIGTKQNDDPIVFEMKDNPNRIVAIGMAVSKNEGILTITPQAADGEGSYGHTSIYCVKIDHENPKEWTLFSVVDNYEAKYEYITNDQSYFIFLTNKNASKNCILGIDFYSPESNWTIVVPQDVNNVMTWAVPTNKNYLVIHYLEDVKSKLELRHLNGTFIKDLPIEMGNIESYAGKRDAPYFFIKFESFLVPNRIYYLNFTNANADDMKLEIYQNVIISDVNPSDYSTNQIKYVSKDGTGVPMFIIHNKNLTRNKENPVLLYGYGGFNIDVTPKFVVERIVFMKNFKGVVAIANLRGGGEYGNEWHEGGSLKNKQNVFDDFQAAAENLIFNNYTNPRKLIIEGRSNGGLLIAACVNQRPELFGAAIASVGVMDMLRYHLFTIGYTWVSEFGSPNDSEYFEYLYAYSPLHNIKLPENQSVQYPAVLVTTSDHDDRVVPAHSYKYTAQLQHVLGRNPRQTNPLLLRVETEAGHGAGKPISKQIEEKVDIFSFVGQSLNLEFYDTNRKTIANNGESVVKFSYLFLLFFAAITLFQI